MKYYDIHGHINFSAYDSDREEIIARAREKNVTMFTVGTELVTSRSAVDLAKKNDDIFAVVGVHPIHSEKCAHDEQELGKEEHEQSEFKTEDLSLYEELAKDSRTVAVGESGLDYFHLDDESIKKQKEVFSHMIDLANKVNKPLMLHLRNGNGKSAYNDAYEMLKNQAKVSGNLHFFAGSIEEAKPFLDMGFTFSFTGVITFAKNYESIIQYLPLSNIMSETDCPYVAPIPYRGKRNEPSFVTHVVKAIAGIKGLAEEKVSEQIESNVKRIFGRLGE